MRASLKEKIEEKLMLIAKNKETSQAKEEEYPNIHRVSTKGSCSTMDHAEKLFSMSYILMKIFHVWLP